jgi:AraC family transcriptional regulator of arabinose operon
MRRLFDTAFALKRLDDPGESAARSHLALAYFAAYRVADQSNEIPADRRLPPAVSAMKREIAERYADPLELRDLARAASVSTHHLVRLCRRHLDTTPMRLLWDTRVDQGVELLGSTGLTVAEIAYRVGFANPFHFSRLCKARHGRSPRDVRAAAWGA